MPEYDPQTWANGVLGGTPLNADRLNHMEIGIASAARTDTLPIIKSLREFGAYMDGATPDDQAFGDALDAMGDNNSQRPMELLIDGPLLLEDTVTIRRKSGKIRMPGWGSSYGATPGSYIKWIGPPGIPMLKITECWGLELEGLRGVGDSTSKPSAFIYFHMDGVSNSNSFITLRRIWVGPLWGYDTDNVDRQFETGILWDGTNLNNDLMRVDTVITHKCDTGFKMTGTQMGEHEFTHVLPTYCGVGIETASTLGITGLHCLANSEYDIKLTGDSRMSVEHYSSEGSAALADMSTTPGTLAISGGNYQAGDNTRADGKIINGQTPYFSNVTLENFYLAHTGGPTPTFRLRGGAEKALSLKNCRGISTVNIDMQADSGGEKRLLIVEQTPSASAIQRFVVNNFDQGNIDFSRFDFAEQDIATRRNAAPTKLESWRQTAATSSEVSRWDFVAGSTREIVARISAFIGSDWTDTGELSFSTKWSGVAMAETLRLLRTGGLFIKNTVLNPSSTPTGGGYLYVDKDDGKLKFKGSSGTVTDIANP